MDGWAGPEAGVPVEVDLQKTKKQNERYEQFIYMFDKDMINQIGQFDPASPFFLSIGNCLLHSQLLFVV
jgi:hypothetical protein